MKPDFSRQGLILSFYIRSEVVQASNFTAKWAYLNSSAVPILHSEGASKGKIVCYCAWDYAGKLDRFNLF